MDHAAIAENAVFKPPRIPYLCSQPYDGLDFAGYPQRRGWDKTRLSRGDFTQHPPQQTAAFFQEWLYFGVLTEVLGPELFDPTSIITTDAATGETCLDTTSLPDLVKQWEKSLYLGRGTEKVKKMNGCFEEASHYSRLFSVKLYESGGTHAPVSPAVALSIQYLAATLQTPFFDSYPFHREARTFWALMGAVDRWHWGRPFLVDAVMAENGWCPNDVERVFSNIDLYRDGVVDLVYACSLGRKTAALSHQGCTSEKCIANDIDDSVYQTKHTHDTTDSQCSHVTVPIDEVKRILKRGGIPLVAVKLSQDGRQYLDVCAYRPGIQYTALSHVWSDGLGNVKDNSLPLCQLQRLQPFISELETKFPAHAGWKYPGQTPIRKLLSSTLVQKPGCFWIDTLCIPLESEYRKLAIGRMRQTYAAARWVLILDSELLAVAASSLPRREIALRMLVSGHMRRVWTLQEAALGIQNLFVQFIDGPQELGIVLGAICGAGKYTSMMHVIRYAYEVDNNIVNQAIGTVHKQTTFQTRSVGAQAAVALLHGRTTSKPRDELLCIASTVGLKESQMAMLHDGSDEDRLTAFYSCFPALPPVWLFTPGPKLQRAGYRWIARSLRAYASAESVAGRQAGEVRGNSAARFYGKEGIGLEVKFAGFVVKSPLVLPLEKFSVHDDSTGRAYWVTCDAMPHVSLEYLTTIGHDVEKSRVGVICESIEDDYIKNGSDAAIVSIYRQAPGMLSATEAKNAAIYSRYICAARVQLKAPADSPEREVVHADPAPTTLPPSSSAARTYYSSIRSRHNVDKALPLWYVA